MSEITIRSNGRIGHVTLTRPDMLNALTAGMCGAIEAALDRWNGDGSVDAMVIDAEGERAFCAGGDIVEMYRSGRRGDLDYGRRFWRDEYRLNARLSGSRLPVISFLQGYTMGGGVGIGCHARHRIVCETSRIAMPECAIGLVPDVGGSFLLARAPGRIGECMGLTGFRAGPADAIHAGFADRFVPRKHWPDLLQGLAATGDTALIDQAAEAPPSGAFEQGAPMIDRVFALPSVAEIEQALLKDTSELTGKFRRGMSCNSPLSMACALELVRMQRSSLTIEQALGLEYRFVHRSVEHTDFMEGIRAVIIDKDNRPAWRHASPKEVGCRDVRRLLAPLGESELKLERVH